MTKTIGTVQPADAPRLARRFVLAAVVMFVTLPIVRVDAEDWPHWRGATRNGVVAEDSGWDRSAWPHVVFTGGRLYCKDRDGQLVCYQIRS